MPISLIGSSLIFVACAEDPSGPQFANDPRPTREATSTVVVTPPPPPSKVAVVKPRMLSELLRPRGAASRIYFMAGPELWTVESDGTAPRRLIAPDAGETVTTFSPSLSGDRVAVFLWTGDEGTSLQILGADGEAEVVIDQISRPEATPLVNGTPGAATPVAATPVVAASAKAGEALPVSLDWSPQGDRLLVGFAPGGLVSIPIAKTGAAETIVGEAVAVAPKAAAWAPTGEQVAYASGEAGRGFANIAVANVPANGSPPRVLLSEERGRAIFHFAWLPDGRSLVFTEGDASAGHLVNTDLWRINADGTARHLVASAGSAAPVGDINLISPSPDGRAVAYTVRVPGDPTPTFHSLWVRDLEANKAYSVEVPMGVNVIDLWWTNAGLAFRTVDVAAPGGGEDSFALYLLAGDGAPQLILRASLDSGTPEATPVAG